MFFFKKKIVLLETIQRLHSEGANLKETECIRIAVTKGYLNVFKFLVQNGCLEGESKQFIGEIFILALQNGHIAIAKELIIVS